MADHLREYLMIEEVNGVHIPYLFSLVAVLRWFCSQVVMDIENPCSFIAFQMPDLTWKFHAICFMSFLIYQIYISFKSPITTEKKVGSFVCITSLTYEVYTSGLVSNGIYMHYFIWFKTTDSTHLNLNIFIPGLILFIFAKCTIDMKTYTNIYRAPNDEVISSSPFAISVVLNAVNSSLCYSLLTLFNFDQTPNIPTMVCLYPAGYLNESHLVTVLITTLSGYSEEDIVMFNTAMHLLLTCWFNYRGREAYIEKTRRSLQNNEQGLERGMVLQQSNNHEPNVLQCVGKGLYNDPKIRTTTTRICIDREICLCCRIRHANIQMLPCTHISLCRDCAIEYGNFYSPVVKYTIQFLLLATKVYYSKDSHHSNIARHLYTFFLLNPTIGDNLGPGAVVECISCRSEVDKVIEYINEYDSRSSDPLSIDD